MGSAVPWNQSTGGTRPPALVCFMTRSGRTESSERKVDIANTPAKFSHRSGSESMCSDCRVRRV